jgi:hypothetical protein
MGHTRRFLGVAGSVRVTEVGICIRLQNSMEILQVPARMLAFTIGRVSEPDRRRSIDAGGPISAIVFSESNAQLEGSEDQTW